MQVFTSQALKAFFPAQNSTPEVLGNSLTLDLEKFSELDWLPGYLAALNTLQEERDRLTQSIAAIEQEGEVYRNQWIEPYIKTKNGKQYSYYQLRWLTGERKKSGQPKVKTKHLSHKVVGEVRAAIERGWQEQFPWMSQYGLRKAIANLKKLGLIQTAQHWITSYKRVMFYRIDYERLETFAGDVCALITTRYVNSDQLDVQSEHTTHTDTSSNTSPSEQQTVVVSEMNESLEDMNFLKSQSCNQASGVEADNPEVDRLSLASSGNDFSLQDAEFPELANAVAQAIAHPVGSPLPAALKRAIAQFPDRVQPAIDYLNYQQQKRQINNPVGYLYQAIVEGWNVQVEKNLILPKGFNKWFDQTKARGLVAAATMIDGIHHTLHVEQGWLPTKQLMETLVSLNNLPPQTAKMN